MIKICPNCGKEFKTKAVNNKCCSQTCRKELARKGRIKTCPVCGKEFDPYGFNKQQTCSHKCGAILCWQKRSANPKPTTRKRGKCPLCGISFKTSVRYKIRLAILKALKARQKKIEVPKVEVPAIEVVDKAEDKVVEVVDKIEVEEKPVEVVEAPKAEKKAKAPKAKPIYNKTCPVCGKEYTTTRENQIYCSLACLHTKLKKGDKFYSKTCPVCGKTFETVRKDQVCCGNACATKKRTAGLKLKLETKKKAEPPKPKITKICPVCGWKYHPNGENSAYCSDTCRINDQWKKKRAAANAKKGKKESELDKYIEEARLCGLSYGKYRMYRDALGKSFEEIRAMNGVY